MAVPRRLYALTLALIGCGPRTIGPGEQGDGSGEASESGGGSEAAPLDFPQACVDEECGPYEKCTSELGVCDLVCMGELPVIADPPGSCQLQIDPEFPPPLLPYLGLFIDGDWVDSVPDCAEEGYGIYDLAYVWLNNWTTMQLCEQACLAFNSAESVELRWEPLWCQW
jgi:hypothetical protein